MRIRAAQEKDLTRIFKMGYDIWGDGVPEAVYIQQCLSSPKYKKGQWHVLENETGTIVSSLLCYKNAFGLEDGSVGIGSMATSPDQRLKGHASRLMSSIASLLIEEKERHIFLYSDVNPAFYERLGFRPLAENLQKHRPSVCMVLDATQNTGSPAVPSYF